MALNLDSSTPVVATSATTSVTSASFTPPVGAVLYAITLHATNTVGGNRTSTLTDTTGLTWTSQVTTPLGPAPSPDGGLARLWTAVVATSTAMTVTSTITANGFGGSVLRVLVYTGADTATPVEGAVTGKSTGGGGAGQVSQVITTSTDLAIPWLANEDWNGAAAPTPGTGVTTDHTSAPNSSDRMWIATRAAISPAGSATINSTAPASGTYNGWIAFAVKPGAGGGGGATLAPPPRASFYRRNAHLLTR